MGKLVVLGGPRAVVGQLVIFRIPFVDQFLLCGTQLFVLADEFLQRNRVVLLCSHCRCQQKHQRTTKPPEHLLPRNPESGVLRSLSSSRLRSSDSTILMEIAVEILKTGEQTTPSGFAVYLFRRQVRLSPETNRRAPSEVEKTNFSDLLCWWLLRVARIGSIARIRVVADHPCQ